jgi:hypothetical protein
MRCPLRFARFEEVGLVAGRVDALQDETAAGPIRMFCDANAEDSFIVGDADDSCGEASA